MTDLIRLTREQLTPDSIDRIAGIVGADAATTTALLAGAVPLLVGNRGTSAAGVAALIAARQADSASMESALALLAGLFGPKVELMARALAGATGSNISAATRALAVTTPLLGNALTATLTAADGPRTREAALLLLAGNQPAAMAAMPEALRRSIGRLPGLAGLYATSPTRDRRDFSWLALAGLVLLAMLIALLRG